MPEYYKYDPKTFAYTGAGVGDSLPENATATPITGLVGNIVYNPASNGWTGDRLPATPEQASQPTADQLMMMNVMKQVAAQNVQIAALQKAMDAAETTKGATV
ncbi:hypothetical protein [Furfurilactobacillus entadae]|uniref:hypothetical protein n=1 Tax=Furfurilactobacillus entadae TaxID=2922307 RepID=UPI0035EBB9C1